MPFAKPTARDAVSAALCALDAELAAPAPAETAAEVAATFKRLARETLTSLRERRLRYAGVRHMMRGTSRRAAMASLALARQYRRLAVDALADAVVLARAA